MCNLLKIKIVRIGDNVVDQSGRMELTCRDWRQKTAIEKTWDNFKTHFKLAHLDLRLATTSRTAGFNSNNAVRQQTTETQILLANSAMLTEAKLAQEGQMMAMQQHMALMAQQMAAMQANQSQPTTAPRNNPNFTPWSYFWTHGGKLRNGQNSQNCRNKAANHQDAATFKNKLEGSTRNCN